VTHCWSISTLSFDSLNSSSSEKSTELSLDSNDQRNFIIVFKLVEFVVEIIIGFNFIGVFIIIAAASHCLTHYFI
jgi:hypothetical protein